MHSCPFWFFNGRASSEIYALSLLAALPTWLSAGMNGLGLPSAERILTREAKLQSYPEDGYDRSPGGRLGAGWPGFWAAVDDPATERRTGIPARSRAVWVARFAMNLI